MLKHTNTLIILLIPSLALASGGGGTAIVKAVVTLFVVFWLLALIVSIRSKKVIYTFMCSIPSYIAYGITMYAAHWDVVFRNPLILLKFVLVFSVMVIPISIALYRTKRRQQLN